MPEREMKSRGGNASRFKIDAGADETEIDIILPVKLPNNRNIKDYKIVKKDIPNAAKDKSYGGKKVRWINNFGIRLKGKFGNKQDPFTDEVEGEQFTYEVIVPGPAPTGYKTLVYFDGANVRPASHTIDNSGNYHFNLEIGDPASGWGG